MSSAGELSTLCDPLFWVVISVVVAVKCAPTIIKALAWLVTRRWL
jgi:hypothetical protein